MAEYLGLRPSLPKEAKLEEYQTVGGKTKLIKLPKIILIESKNRKVLCSAVISEYENEVIANDRLTENLGIIFEKVGQG